MQVPIHFGEPLGDWPGPALPDVLAVDGSHRHDTASRRRQENFFGSSQLIDRKRGELCLNVEPAGEFHHRAPGNPFKHAVVG